MQHETIHLAIKICDHYLMRKQILKSSYQLLAITSLFIACKFDVRTFTLSYFKMKSLKLQCFSQIEKGIVNKELIYCINYASTLLSFCGGFRWIFLNTFIQFIVVFATSDSQCLSIITVQSCGRMKLIFRPYFHTRRQITNSVEFF